MPYNMSDTTLGAELKRLRGDRTLRDMQEISGVDHSVLGRIEKGQIATPARDTLAAVCLGYGMPLEYAAQLVYCGAEVNPRPRRHLLPA